MRWIVITMHGIPDWASEGEVRTTGVPFRVTDAAAEIAAVRQGLGMTTLPCFVGDTDPLLARVPGTDLHMYGTLWVLTQGETRKTKRVRLFTEFVSRRLSAYAPLLAGLSKSHD
jgi:DNA-binding transcriptional LysR family regulator